MTKKKVAKKAPAKKKVTKKKAPVKKKTSDKKATKKVATKKVAKKTTTRKEPTIEAAPKPKKKRKTNYLNNADLYEETLKSKEQGKMTDKLAHMLMTLVARYAKKGSFAGYTYNDDMQGYAAMMLVKTWQSFNPEKSSNAFAFFTQCVKHSFIQYLNQERRQRDIRDEILVSRGMNPSFTYTAAYEEQQKERAFAHDEQDFHANEKQRKNLEKLGTKDDESDDNIDTELDKLLEF